MARSTRSGTLVGPGICKKWRPLRWVKILSPKARWVRVCVNGMVHYPASTGASDGRAINFYGDKLPLLVYLKVWGCISKRGEAIVCQG